MAYLYEDDRDMGFADPGGESALRAEVGGGGKCPSCKKRTGRTWRHCANCGAQLNPRCLPCPDCGQPNRLTPEDVAKGYCCDGCARRNEGWGY